MAMTPLIDTTEMYVRTLWELEEEGITPIRARLVERLGLTAPAVSETVLRLQDEGLMVMHPDRTLGLTDQGRALAVSVMRKHRLAELLLTDVIGLEWEYVHVEACRWEHVISDMVEQRTDDLLGAPTHCPHGNPIPQSGDDRPADHGLLTIAEAAKEGRTATIARISEMLQGDVPLMRAFRDQGLLPGARVSLTTTTGSVLATLEGRAITVPAQAVDLVYVAPVADG
jgi:DtxR family transcriptional regulator, Mn-dependent transcriptional regulator